MDLLILKSGPDYIRVKNDTFLIVGLDKASVFPMDRLETVRQLADQARDQGFSRLTLKKLVLTEEEMP